MLFYQGEKLCLASKQTARYIYLPKQSQHCFHGPHADCVQPRCLCSLFHCRKAKMDSQCSDQVLKICPVLHICQQGPQGAQLCSCGPD